MQRYILAFQIESFFLMAEDVRMFQYNHKAKGEITRFQNNTDSLNKHVGFYLRSLNLIV